MKINIIKNAKIWFIASWLFILLSIGSLFYSHFKFGSALNFGIDFTGGFMLEVKFEKPISKDDLENKINSQFQDLKPRIQSMGENIYSIKAKSIGEKEFIQFKEFLEKTFGEYEEKQFSMIGPTVGAVQTWNYSMSVIIATIMIILYIAFAFRNIPEELSPFNFGFAAFVALVHDVIITIGVFSFISIIKSVEIDTLFITAILTIMGFSVHDTIVTFDRIRENLKGNLKGETFENISEKAIHQTMKRSINTSVSVLIPLFFLFLFGSDSISYFVLALFVGILVGTYSSIFLATPVLVYLSPKTGLSNIKEKKKEDEENDRFF